MDFSKYIVPMVAIGVYLILAMVKGLMPDNTKKFIPLIAGVLGVVFCCWSQASCTFATIVGGLASGLSATGIDQAVSVIAKKTTVAEDEPETENVDKK
jgi:hypothetical protein